MKSLTKLFILGSLSAFQVQAREGGSVGNGGDSVVCFKDIPTKERVRSILIENQATKNQHYPKNAFTPDVLAHVDYVEMYDLFLAERAGDNSYNPWARLEKAPSDTSGIIDSKEPWEDIIDERLNLLRKQSDYYLKIEESRKALKPRNWIGAEAGVVEIYDGPVPSIMDDKCIVVQIAIQESGQVTYAKRLYDLMGKHSPVHQAALRWHEYAMNHLHNARQVQREVGLIFSKDFEDMSAHQIGQELSSMGIEAAEATEWNSNALGKLRIWAGSDPASNHYRLVTAMKVSFPQGFDAMFSEIWFDPSQNRITSGILAQTLQWGDIDAPVGARISLIKDLNNKRESELQITVEGVPNLFVRGFNCLGRVTTSDGLPAFSKIQFYASGRLRNCLAPEEKFRYKNYLLSSNPSEIFFLDVPGDLVLWRAIFAEDYQWNGATAVTGSWLSQDSTNHISKIFLKGEFKLPSGGSITRAADSAHSPYNSTGDFGLSLSWTPSGELASVSWILPNSSRGLSWSELEVFKEKFGDVLFQPIPGNYYTFATQIDSRENMNYKAKEFAEFYPSGHVKRTKIAYGFSFHVRGRKSRKSVGDGHIATLDEDGYLIAIDDRPI